MLRTLGCAVLTNFYLSAHPQPFTVVYGFPNVTNSTGATDPGPPPSQPGLAPGTFTAHGLGPNSTASGRFSFTGWPGGSVDGVNDAASFTGVLSPFSYFEVCVAPSPGFTLDLHSMRFDVRRSGTGPRNYCLRSGQDSFTANLAVSTGTSTNLSVLPGDVFFWKYDSLPVSSDQKGSVVELGNTHMSIAAPVFFRIYAWNAEASGGSFSIDNFGLNGVLRDSLTTGVQVAGQVGGCNNYFKITESGVTIFPQASGQIISVSGNTFGGVAAGYFSGPATLKPDPGINILMVTCPHGRQTRKFIRQ
jgi:hypothetical protein